MLETAWRKLVAVCNYERFERIALYVIQALLALIAAVAIVLVVIQIVRDLGLGADFMDKAVLQDTFGSILTILILLEFNHSVHVAIVRKSGAIQARMVVLIAVLVIARKLMLLDFSTVDVKTLLGYAALLLALGGLHWLIAHSEARHRNGVSPPPLAGEGQGGGKSAGA